MNNKNVLFLEAMDSAKALLSEDDDNPEYDRGMAELLVDIYDVGEGMEEGREIVMSLLRPQMETVIAMTNTEAADMLDTLSDYIQNWEDPGEYLEALGIAGTALRTFPDGVHIVPKARNSG